MEPEPLFVPDELFVPADPLEAAFDAFDAEADFVSPDLLPPDLLAIGVLAASLAPAVFLGAADLDDDDDVVDLAEPDEDLAEPDDDFAEPDDADLDAAADFPEPAVLEPAELPALFPLVDFDDEPLLLVELADVFDEPEPPFDEADVLFDAPDPLFDEPDVPFDEPVEEPELFELDDPVVPAAIFAVEDLPPDLERAPDADEPATDSITVIAAPDTAPAAAPASTSPIASLVLS